MPFDFIQSKRPTGPLIMFGMVLLTVIVATIITKGLYITPGNLTDILRMIAPEAIMAMGMTFVILTAGIDLSVGSILALASVACAAILTSSILPGSLLIAIPLAILVALIVGGLCGALQGGLIAWLDIQAFVVTLAGLIGFRGVAKLYTDNQKIQLGSEHAVANLLSTKPVMIGTLMAVTLFSMVLLRFTVFGRSVRAVGDNERAAHYAGLPVPWLKLAVYTYSGMLAGIAGLLLCARNTVGDANFGVMDELETIAMVVIGGTSLMGGKGSVIGTVFGVFIMGTVINVLGLKNVDSNVQQVLLPVIILLAVGLQLNRKRV